MVPGWECGKCSQANPEPRPRCRRCGRKKLGNEKSVLARKGDGKRTKEQRLLSKMKKCKTTHKRVR